MPGRSSHGDEYGSDDGIISARLWPTIRDKTLVHTEFGNRYGHGGVFCRFPTRLAEGLRFIGERTRTISPTVMTEFAMWRQIDSRVPVLNSEFEKLNISLDGSAAPVAAEQWRHSLCGCAN